MQSPSPHWEYHSYNQPLARQLQKELGIHPVFCALLVQRGITDFDAAKAFFRPQLTQLHDPFLMQDMEKAVIRLAQAIIKKEKIILYGDYDVDGTTAVALLYNFLSNYHQLLDFYIPDRQNEGYGLSETGVQWTQQQGGQLLIVLDCGIKAHDNIALAKQKGIDVIVCDHHLPADSLPDAAAILNPKRTDCNYPNKNLSGGAIAFKYIEAFAQYLAIDFETIVPLLDLVAISLAADFVPLTGENRVLMHFGLQVLNEQPQNGIALLQKALDRADIYTVRDIVFGIAPVLNAAGRMDHAGLSVQLLTTNDKKQATALVQDLISKNDLRREIEQKMVAEAYALVETEADYPNRYSAVVYQADWHEGVVGIVAARLVDFYYKPSIVLTLSGNKIIGSARTAGGFDLYHALEKSKDLLLDFGGHKHAAGLSLAPAQLAAFTERFEAVVAEQVQETPLVSTQMIDAEVAVQAIDSAFWNILQQFAPFGPSNMRPVFASHDVMDTGFARVLKDKHLKFTVQRKDKKDLSAIAFNQAAAFDLVEQASFSVCYVLEQNTYKNRTKLQLNVRGIRPTE